MGENSSPTTVGPCTNTCPKRRTAIRCSGSSTGTLRSGEGFRRPILRGSVKNYLVFLAAEGVFYSHTGSDIAPVLHNFVKNKRTVRMFIEHGIVGLKKAKLAIDSRSTHLGPEADLWVCSSAFEQAIKTEDWGLPRDRGPITGLARYDALLPKDSYQR